MAGSKAYPLAMAIAPDATPHPLHRAGLQDHDRLQLAAWLSFWEVTRVGPRRIDVHDLLTGERRSVSEVMGSKSVTTRDTILARVVDFRGTSYFGGMYGRSLSPLDAGEVVATVRGILRVRKGNVPIERLRDAIAGRQMIHWWSDAVATLDERRSKPLASPTRTASRCCS